MKRRFGLDGDTVTRLIYRNDSYKWKSLTDLLLKLELYHVVRPFAKNVRNTSITKKAVVA